MATEPGHKFIPEDQKKNLVLLPPDSGWDTFKEVIRDKTKFNVYAIDTISGLYPLCMDSVCEVNKWTHPEDASHGRGWSAVRKEFYKEINRLAHVVAANKSTLVLIDHSREEIVETTTSRIIKVNCAMPGQARSIILPVPDHIWFLGYAEKDPNDALKSVTNKRALFITGNDRIEAGCRDPNVDNRIHVITPLSKKDPYNQILQAMYGDKE